MQKGTRQKNHLRVVGRESRMGSRAFSLLEVILAMVVPALGLGISWWAMRRFRFAPELRGPKGSEGAG